MHRPLADLGPDPESWSPLPATALNYFRFCTALSTSLIVVAIAAGIFIFVAEPGWWLVLLLVLALPIMAWELLVWDRWRYKYRFYYFDNESFRDRRGKLFHRERSLPVTHILSLEISSNPLLRKFDLVQIKFNNGIDQDKFGPFSPQTAEQIRAQLLKTT